MSADNVFITSGTLQAANNNVTGTAVAMNISSGAAFNLNNFNTTLGTIEGAGNINLGSGTLVTTGNASKTVSGIISGTGGSLTKGGSGTLTLSNANTYTGNTTINAGTLQQGVANAVGSNSAIVLGGGTFNLNGFAASVGSLSGSSGTVSLGAVTLTIGNNNTSTTYSGTLSGTGGLIKAGSGILTLSGSSANGYTGSTTINAGTLSIANINSPSTSGFTVGTNGTLNVSNASNFTPTITLNGTLTGSGTTTIGTTLSLGSNVTIGTTTSTDSLTLNGLSGTGALTLNGAGTITLNNAISGFSSVTDSAGLTNLNGGAITTTGNQTYSGTLNVATPTTLTISGSSSTITMPASITNPDNLTFAGNGSLQNAQIALANKSNVIHITNAGIGYVNDPINFSNFNTIINGSGGLSVVFDATASSLSLNGNVATATVNGFTFYFNNISSLSVFSGNIPVVISPSQANAASNLVAQMTSSTGGFSSVQNQQNQTDNASAANDAIVSSAFSNSTVSSNINDILTSQDDQTIVEKENTKFKICAA